MATQVWTVEEDLAGSSDSPSWVIVGIFTSEDKARACYTRIREQDARATICEHELDVEYR